MRLLINLLNPVARACYYAVGFLRASLSGIRVNITARVSPHAQISGAYYLGDVTVGRDVTIGHMSYVNSGKIDSGRIGHFCSIGYDVHIGPTEHDMSGWTTSPLGTNTERDSSFTQPDPPVIEDDVWLGAGVVVLRGSRVSQGSVIGARSVVKGIVPPYEVWAGVPARFIRPRFPSAEQRELAKNRLEKSLIEAGVMLSTHRR